VETRYRGHATKLAASARKEGYGLVLTLGGDGTVNEVVNGILGPGAHEPAAAQGGSEQWQADLPPAHELPALAALPGGSANVFTGALRLPRDPVDATGQILQALAENRERTIGLGMADGRYFTFNSGLGLDAEVVRAVQGVRAHGRTVTPSLYVRLALRHFYRQTDRNLPAVAIELADRPPSEPVFVGIVSNTAPWTYLGSREVHVTPLAGFDTGLDVLGLGTMSSLSTLRLIGQMLTTRGGSSRNVGGARMMSFHDQPAVTLRAGRPVAFQIDGEYVGEREVVGFRSVPDALRVVA